MQPTAADRSLANTSFSTLVEQNPQKEEEERKRIEEEEKAHSLQSWPHYGVLHVRTPIALSPYALDDQGALARTATGNGFSTEFEYNQCMVKKFNGECEDIGFTLTVEGKFEHNGLYAWHKEANPHPRCPYHTFGWSAELNYCNWAGANHQHDHDGGFYHITAQGIWHVSPLGGPVSAEEPVSVYLYGDGWVSGHNTNCVCNPA